MFDAPVSLSLGYGKTSFPICSKFSRNVYVMSGISCIFFFVRIVNGWYSKIHKRIAIHCRLRTEYILRAFFCDYLLTSIVKFIFVNQMLNSMFPIKNDMHKINFHFAGILKRNLLTQDLTVIMCVVRVK